MEPFARMVPLKKIEKIAKIPYNQAVALKNDYLKTLKERAKTSRVYRKYQLDGLEIAEILKDEKHKSLYIKLAKLHGGQRLRELARMIAENKTVKNKGAYFMSCLKKKL